MNNRLKAKPSINTSYSALDTYVDIYLYKKHDKEACLFYLARKTDELVIHGQKYTILASTAILDLLSLLSHKEPNAEAGHNFSSKLA